ncbi:MAG: hypothetical protein JSR33_05015 [Proteobacteria bacterium]|nr:hypothetical protein [Pseudomonadota bacterium]
MKNVEYVQSLVDSGQVQELKQIKISALLNILQDININKALGKGDLATIKFLKSHQHPLHLPGERNPLFYAFLAPEQLQFNLVRYLLNNGVDPRLPFVPLSFMNSDEVSNARTCSETPIRYAYTLMGKKMGDLLCSSFENFSECQYFEAPIPPAFSDLLFPSPEKYWPVLGLLGHPLEVTYKVIGTNRSFRKLVKKAMHSISKLSSITFVPKEKAILTLSYQPDERFFKAASLNLNLEIPFYNIRTCQYQINIEPAVVSLNHPLAITIVLHELIQVVGLGRADRKKLNPQQSLISEHFAIFNPNATISPTDFHLYTLMPFDVAALNYLYGPKQIAEQSITLNGRHTCTEAHCISTLRVFRQVNELYFDQFTGDAKISTCQTPGNSSAFSLSLIGAQGCYFMDHDVVNVYAGPGDDHISICSGTQKIVLGGGENSLTLKEAKPQFLTIEDFDATKDQISFSHCFIKEMEPMDNKGLVIATSCNQKVTLKNLKKEDLFQCLIGSYSINCNPYIRFIAHASYCFGSSTLISTLCHSANSVTDSVLSKFSNIPRYKRDFFKMGVDLTFKLLLGGLMFFFISALLKFILKKFFKFSEKTAETISITSGLVLTIYRTDLVSMAMAAGGTMMGKRISRKVTAGI